MNKIANFSKVRQMNKSELLEKLKEEIFTYDDFSEIKYKTKYISIFENIFGLDNRFTKEANNIADGWNVKGSIDAMYGKISHDQFMRNVHAAFINLLDEAIDFLKMNDEIEMEKNIMKDKVFIVHGHDEKLKYQLSDWLRKIGVEPIILHEQANGGTSSILDKLERYSDVDCAIALFTADDVGSEKGKKLQPRARQNVVFEAGMFLGKLGKKRVIVLYEEGIESPGDLGGCVYIPADKYDGWKEKLRLEFDAMGIKYIR